MAEEWEESTVYVDICGVASNHLFPADSSSQTVEVLGLASERPLMQVNGHTFAGHYEDTVGSHLIMASNKANSATGSGGSTSSVPSVNWEYLCKTDKKLVMQPAFLVEQASTSDTPGGDSAVSAAEPSAETSIPSQNEETIQESFTRPGEEPASQPAIEPASQPAQATT